MQKVSLELDLTGLRADRPVSGKFDNFFVHPQLTQKNDDEEQALALKNETESLEFFAGAKHWTVVTGVAGAGKSTWSKWLQREALSKWIGISIRVELRQFTIDTLPSLHELVRNAAGKHIAEDITAERIKRWLDKRQVMFIFDGFDEVAPQDRNETLEWIRGFEPKAHNCSIIITSRPLTTEHLDRLESVWEQWSIDSFDEKRIITYIQKWYAFIPLTEVAESDRHIDALALAKDWQNDSTIQPLTGNPLLLSTLLMVHHLDGELPNGRAQLYKRYVNGMLGLWDSYRKIEVTHTQLTSEQKHQIMRDIALKMFLSQQDQVDEDVMLDIVGEILEKIQFPQSSEDTLKVLRERSGLLIGPGVYSFAHKTVAEYLVAETVLQGNQRSDSGERIDRFHLFEHRKDDRWNVVIFLWAGLAPIADVEKFIEACIREEMWDLAYGLLYDQYNRILRQDLHRLSFYIFRKEQIFLKTLPEHPSFGWISSGPSSMNEDKFMFSSLALRGISNISFGSLVDKLVKDRILNISDLSNTNQIGQELIVAFTLTELHSIDEWRICLASRSARLNEHEWAYWALERVIQNGIIKENKLEISDIIKVFFDTYPNLCDFVPIVILSSCLISIYFHNIEKVPRQIEFIIAILQFLPSIPIEYPIATPFLYRTNNWSLGFRNESIRDLFSYFIDQVEQLIEIENIQLDKREIVQASIQYVKELKEYRDSLPLPEGFQIESLAGVNEEE